MRRMIFAFSNQVLLTRLDRFVVAYGVQRRAFLLSNVVYFQRRRFYGKIVVTIVSYSTLEWEIRRRGRYV